MSDEQSNKLSTIAPYIPPTLMKSIIAAPQMPVEPIVDELDATVMFADISGFTPLTEALARKGAEGPEELTRILNGYFTRMIAIIESEGGESVQFSGDAVTVLFPTRGESLGKTVKRAVQAAKAMQAAMTDFRELKTSIGIVALQMTISIGVGHLKGIQVGGVFNRWEYIIAGDPLRQIGEAEKKAQKGDIILSDEALEIIHPQWLTPTPIEVIDYDSIENKDFVETYAKRFLAGSVLSWLNKSLQTWLAELRPMSVIFVGIDGLDYDHPQTIKYLQQFIQMAQATTYRYEGAIRQLAVDDKGTVLLILFGAPPFAHEDDPARAVRCAMDLQSWMGNQSDFPFSLSVGITSGRVFSGPMGSPNRSEYTVIGDVVNLSARFMGKAGSGNIMCDYETYRSANNQITFNSLTPIRVKGKSGLIRVYEPTGIAINKLHKKTNNQLIGRKVELQQLMDAFERVQKHGEGQILSIEGDAGVGKSRLVKSFMQYLQDSTFTYLVGTGLSIEQKTPYRAWRDVLTDFFDLNAIKNPIEKQVYVATTVAELIPNQIERLPLINDILNLGIVENELTEQLSPQLRQQSLNILIIELLKTWAKENPLVLIMDDVHWLDKLSWELMLNVSRSLLVAKVPFLMITILRPLEDNSPHRLYFEQLQQLDFTKKLNLGILNSEEIIQLIVHRLNIDAGDLPILLADAVLKRAGGNPFYAEELIFTLRDQKIIELVTDGEKTKCLVKSDLRKATQKLPDSIQGLILARIDRLPPERQLILKVGAVIGRTFAYTPLYYTLNQYIPIEAQEINEHLNKLEILNLTPLEIPEPDLTYIFKHIITKEVAYQTLLFAQRRQLHRTVAKWFEDTFQNDDFDMLAPYYSLLAYHYQIAEDQKQERYYSILAGEQAARQFANEVAIDFFSRALELTDNEDYQIRYDILKQREKVYDLLGKREEQLQDIEARIEISKMLKDIDTTVEAKLRWINYSKAVSDYSRGIETVQEIISVSNRLENIRLAADAYFWGGIISYEQANYSEAQGYYEDALRIYQQVENSKGQAESLQSLGILARTQGKSKAAMVYYKEALKFAGQSGDRRLQSTIFHNIGIVYNIQGKLKLMENTLSKALSLYKEIGDRRSVSYVNFNLGTLNFLKGYYVDAKKYYEKAINLCRETNNPYVESSALGYLGATLQNVGLYYEAKTLFEAALQLNRKVGNRSEEKYTLSNLSELYLHLGDYEQAKNFAQSAVKLAKELKDQHIESHAYVLLGHITSELGQYKEAETAYQSALELRKKGKSRLEPLAGLALAALAQKKSEQALQHATTIFDFAENTDEVSSTPDILKAYLHCYQILLQQQDERANDILNKAYLLLQNAISKIPDEKMAYSFLNNVEVNKQIMEAYQLAE
ncbi:MAG: tetratricopeptide repeat protein [Chitinophagales bacterium]